MEKEEVDDAPVGAFGHSSRDDDTDLEYDGSDDVVLIERAAKTETLFRGELRRRRVPVVRRE